MLDRTDRRKAHGIRRTANEFCILTSVFSLRDIGCWEFVTGNLILDAA
ncbi:hypothetical protein D1BOALGB6SA_4753 [Olavius sp. associated proteobacterium Delta 1]|nr:hypothetical protein D1BOALGB6SA_4753 [Olavius sp. associated proteobacterium Delta 1]